MKSFWSFIICQETRKAFPCHPKQRLRQFLGTIPAEHGGGRAGTGTPSCCPLLPSSHCLASCVSQGLFAQLAFGSAGPPAKAISAALGCLEGSGTRGDGLEENALLGIARPSLAQSCCHTQSTGKRGDFWLYWGFMFPGFKQELG